MKFTCRAAALLALTAVAGAAGAQDVIATVQNPWAGWYAGGNIGGAWNNTCNTWEPGAAITSGNYPGLANKFYNRDCPNNGNFIGGVQFGYFFQTDQWVWGFGADYEAIGSKTNTRSYTLASGSATYPIPDGTYSASGKTSPNGIFLLGPKVGYSLDQWLPYFRVGGAFAGGQHTSTLSYTPSTAAAAAGAVPASFSGGKNFKASGFNVGFGLEYDVQGPWSLEAEYNYINLGKGTNSTYQCTGVSSAFCAKYSNLELDNVHNSFTMNLFRVGVNYHF